MRQPSHCTNSLNQDWENCSYEDSIIFIKETYFYELFEIEVKPHNCSGISSPKDSFCKSVSPIFEEHLLAGDVNWGVVSFSVMEDWKMGRSWIWKEGIPTRAMSTGVGSRQKGEQRSKPDCAETWAGGEFGEVSPFCELCVMCVGCNINPIWLGNFRKVYCAHRLQGRWIISRKSKRMSSAPV